MVTLASRAGERTVRVGAESSLGRSPVRPSSALARPVVGKRARTAARRAMVGAAGVALAILIVAAEAAAIWLLFG
jgi:hypothetical protein